MEKKKGEEDNVVGVEVLAQAGCDESLVAVVLQGERNALTHQPQRAVGPEDLTHRDRIRNPRDREFFLDGEDSSRKKEV